MAVLDVCQPTLDPGLGGGVTARTGVAADNVLSRRFRVERVVGMGAMGLVVAAHHLALDVRVALKLMRPELRDHQRFVGRFLREARAAARLTSRHAVRMLDVGTLDDGVPYLVMEYLEGVDLATELRARGPAAVARAAAIVVEACHAVGEAHGLGIIHRDLKPANLFVTHGPDGEPLIKVLDLGVCRFIAEDELAETSSAAVVGTPRYMAPEQLRAARAADARSDIWSLGVILYELITGRVPFLGHGVADQCARTMLDPVPAIEVANVPPAFAAVIARCLAKDPAARFQTMAELAAALRPFSAEHKHVPAPRRSRRTIAVAAAIVAATVAVSGEPLRARAPRQDIVAPAHPQGMISTSATACAAPPLPSALVHLEPHPRPPARMASVHARRATPVAPAAAFDPLATAN